MGRRQKLKQHPEWQDMLADYVREIGRLDANCVTILPQCVTFQTIWNAYSPTTNFHIPEFYTKIQKALEDYKTMHTHPSEDPEFRRDVYSQMKQMAKAGRSSRTVYDRDDKGRIIQRNTVQPGIDKWLYEAAFPPIQFCEEAILVVLPNQIEFILNQDFEDEITNAILRALHAFKHAAIEELHLKGMKTKMIEGGKHED